MLSFLVLDDAQTRGVGTRFWRPTLTKNGSLVVFFSNLSFSYTDLFLKCEVQSETVFK